MDEVDVKMHFCKLYIRWVMVFIVDNTITIAYKVLETQNNVHPVHPVSCPVHHFPRSRPEKRRLPSGKTGDGSRCLFSPAVYRAVIVSASKPVQVMMEAVHHFSILQRLFRIHGIPPFRLVFEPFGEPGVDGFVPFGSFLVVEYLVVLSYNLYESCRFA